MKYACGFHNYKFYTSKNHILDLCQSRQCLATAMKGVFHWPQGRDAVYPKFL